MKSLFISLTVASLAISGATFKNVNHTIDEGFLVQTIWGTYTRSNNDFGVCALISPFPCKYLVTDLGRANIPNQLTYSASDIANYLSNGWLWIPEDSTDRIYIGL